MRNQDNLKFDSKPALRKPYIICGLNGSFNGGDVSVDGVDYFISQFNGVKFAEMPASRYHIYQIPGVESLRPAFKMQDGLIVESQLQVIHMFKIIGNKVQIHVKVMGMWIFFHFARCRNFGNHKGHIGFIISITYPFHSGIWFRFRY